MTHYYSTTGKEFQTKYKLALQLLSSQHLSVQNYETEFSIVQNIQKILASKGKFQDVRKFDELYAKLSSSVSTSNSQMRIECSKQIFPVVNSEKPKSSY